MYVFVMTDIIDIRVIINIDYMFMDAGVIHHRISDMVNVVVAWEQRQRQKCKYQHPTDGLLAGGASVET